MSPEHRPPATVFISYSHRDRAALERLQVHLKPLEREGLVERWDDTRIQAGERWKDEIKDALASARVAVLLVSADFLASDFIADEELPPLLEAERARGLVILPVILGPCRFQKTRLAEFQTVNDPARPLSQMSRHQKEVVWHRLAERVEAALELPAGPLRDRVRDGLQRLRPGRIPRPLIAVAALAALLVLALIVVMRQPSPSPSPTTPPPAPPAVLEGYVIDAETNEPLPGVTLTIQDADTLDGRTPTTTTDVAGRFRFDNLRPGSDPARLVRLVSRKAGYEPSSSDPPLGTITQTIKLRPAPTTEAHP